MNNIPLWKLSHKMAAHPLSLLMILHKCHEYYDFCDELADVCNLIAQIKPDEEPDENEFGAASLVAQKALALLKSLNGVSPTVLEHIEDLGNHFSEIASGLDGAYILSHMETIRNMVRAELEARMFMLIPPPDDKKVRRPKPFGVQVYRAFPTARVELTNAGTAFAVELYTASIFHLMRSTEIAMRALCNDRGMTHIKSAPIEMMQWGDIIKGLDAENLQIANWSNSLGQIKVQAQEFYNGATAQFRGIKDEWRNHVSHTRQDYSRSRAEDATHHVKRLMQTLATRISENTSTPKIWTAAELR
jgi:hypothetical protein